MVGKPSIKRHIESLYRTYTVDGGFMVAATAVRESIPKYFPDELDLPLSPDHKTWYTERLCPPLLAQALRRERLAIFIAQLHYWLQKEDVGVYKHGFHWIYNAEWEWREQFPWMSEHTIGRIRRSLERLGYVVSNDFNRNPLDRTKYSTLDYYLIAVETGWNPLGLDLNRSYPHPPEFTKGKRQRGRHKSDSTPRVYLRVDDEPDSLKQPEIVDSARLQNASCNTVTMHSALLPVSSIYKEVPNISKSNLEDNLKIEQTEASQGVGSSQFFARENDTQSNDGQEEVISQVTEFKSEEQCSAASLINDEEIESPQQFLASLNTAAQRAERYRTPASDQIRRVRIPGLDEETHEILWKHQATLEKLNADLNAERIKSAIADNPQHLEDAILAFKENSAKGAKTKEAATGFLFNALRYGWKPRQSSSSASAGVQVYTPPSQMLEDPLPPTLEQLVERKRLMWQNASILRPGVEAWVQQTNGVIMTPDGPALADVTNAPLEPDLEQNEAEHLGTPSERDFPPPEENASSSHSKPDTSLAVVPPNRYSARNQPTPPNNSPNPAPSLPPSSDRALGVDEDLSHVNLTSPEKSTFFDSSATSESPIEPPVIRRTPCIESNQLWYADRIKKPYKPPFSPFYVKQRVIYEGKEYLVAAPGNPHTQLEGLAKAVANFWLTPVEEVHLNHEQNSDSGNPQEINIPPFPL